MSSSEYDEAVGFDIQDDFERFNQKYDVFRRSWWDERIMSEKARLFYATYREPLKTWRKADGFTQKDYALRNAAWHVSDVFTELKEGEGRREGFNDEFTLCRGVGEGSVTFESPADAAAEIKHVAKTFGADLVGISGFDKRWMYTSKFSDLSRKEKPQEVPEGMTSVIVTAQSMDHDLIRTVPSALSGAATGHGYSRDAMVVLSIAQYIQNLGYRAVASMNDTSLVIPAAIQAGLGEYGRLGLLITKEFGPRVRLGKIFTDLPLAHDSPVRFGVKVLRDMPALLGLVPGEGNPRRRPQHRAPQRVEHTRREEVVGERGEVLQLLDGSEHRLLDLRARLSLQQGLLQVVVPAGALAGGHAPQARDALARRQAPPRRARGPQAVVGESLSPG